MAGFFHRIMLFRRTHTVAHAVLILNLLIVPLISILPHCSTSFWVLGRLPPIFTLWSSVLQPQWPCPFLSWATPMEINHPSRSFIYFIRPWSSFVLLYFPDHIHSSSHIDSTLVTFTAFANQTLGARKMPPSSGGAGVIPWHPQDGMQWSCSC